MERRPHYKETYVFITLVAYSTLMTVVAIAAYLMKLHHNEMKIVKARLKSRVY